jgi:deoxyribose-phosphate aldolase
LTQEALELLVKQIGEQILARLDGRLPDAYPAVAPGTLAEEAVGAPGDAHANAADPSVARLIDHTLLKPDATRDDVVRLCREARECGFAAVCVNPVWVALAASELRGSAVKVATVVGFPLGATPTPVKALETELALRNGATEVDMAINLGALKSGDYDTVKLDIEAVVTLAHRYRALVKAILETGLLEDREKSVAAAIAVLAGADFVKTSTGLGPGGATEHDVRLLKAAAGDAAQVKASAGIRTLARLKSLAAAGATRIGTSSGVAIVRGTGQA